MICMICVEQYRPLSKYDMMLLPCVILGWYASSSMRRAVIALRRAVCGERNRMRYAWYALSDTVLWSNIWSNTIIWSNIWSNKIWCCCPCVCVFVAARASFSHHSVNITILPRDRRPGRNVLIKVAPQRQVHCSVQSSTSSHWCAKEFDKISTVERLLE